MNTFNVGGGRSTTTLQFNDVTGGFRLRGTGGTDADRTTMVVGNRNTGGTGSLTTTGNVLLNGHPVDLKFATLTLGQMSRNSTTEANFNGVGNFEFDQGTVDATTIGMGVVSGNSPTSRAAGTLTVGAGGMLMAGTISLDNVSSGVAGSSASGTLNISGGTVNCVGKGNPIISFPLLTHSMLSVGWMNTIADPRYFSDIRYVINIEVTVADKHINRIDLLWMRRILK